MKYVIEHMDTEVWPWSVIEYKHAASAVGSDNLIITNVQEKEHGKLSGLCDVKKEHFTELDLSRVCILDPTAETTLVPEDANKFDCLVFGGILGNEKPEGRTKELVLQNAERRNLGKDQFSTDNAVMVAKQIIDGKRFEELEFIDDLSIDMGEDEEIILPFKYLIVDGEAFVAEELIDHIKREGF